MGRNISCTTKQKNITTPPETHKVLSLNNELSKGLVILNQ